ncbi:hypothetical protein GGI00_003603, partial [Coemansia sp. RSA 2681]
GPSLEEQEKKLKAKYGALGGNMAKRIPALASQRKYFDSGDYAMSKAGKNTNDLSAGVGEKHPSPESIPHQQLAAASAAAPPPLAGSTSSVGSINSGGLPIVSGVGVSVGAAGTMANPSGLSPPAAHHVASRDDAAHLSSESSPPGSSSSSSSQLPSGATRLAAAHLAGGSAAAPPPSLGADSSQGPGAPGARPAFVRRVSQTPAGMQYRVKN